jgi:midasin
MTFLDGLGSLPQLSSYSADALTDLKKDAAHQLDSLFPVPPADDKFQVTEDHDRLQLGSFSMPRGPLLSNPSSFSLHAPTTQNNVNRVVRACQLPKPILLEGSPGVGKTSLVAALANICGHHLCRINLSDQTDLVDLFGSDLPVEGGTLGQFAWKDADFLRALQEGHWVLLDEMNLAPQAVLEGLNAVLDHRGTVYIPELGRSFTRHPSFRIFAAQNPLHQGGGRKGLPKSFLNRFTKVYVQELTSEDTLLICRALYPAIPADELENMIGFTARLNEEAMVKRSFAREGAPWEFNLRDILRWGSLIQQPNQSYTHPAAFLDVLFLQRFRTSADRDFARALFESFFTEIPNHVDHNPPLTLSPSYVQVGRGLNARRGYAKGKRSTRVLHAHHQALQAMLMCVTHRWLGIVSGPANSGKNLIVRLLARLTGNPLLEICINSATDTSDLLGSFEEVDTRSEMMPVLLSMLDSLRYMSASLKGSRLGTILKATCTIDDLLTHISDYTLGDIINKVMQVKADLDQCALSEVHGLERALQSLSHVSGPSNRFQWVDGPLVRALKAGHWVLLDGANLCNPSVLDRLNSLCENGGFLTLNEKGAVNGAIETIEPHPNFRLFMGVDNRFGELSRAMRNRGVEMALSNQISWRDRQRLAEYLGVPSPQGHFNFSLRELTQLSTQLRRGLKLVDQELPTPELEYTSQLIAEDSTGSAALSLMASFLRAESYPSSCGAYLIAHCIAQSQLVIFRRLLADLLGHGHHWPNVLRTLASLAHPHITNTAVRMREVLNWNISLPTEHQPSQASDCELPYLVLV